MASLSDRDKQAVWHPYTPQKHAPDPIPVSRASGTCIEDEAGNRYIDAVSSWWVTVHGHAHPYIAEKIYRQALTLEQVIFTGFTHEPAVALAERLLQKLPPGFARVFYSDNGSTATEVALKMAIQYWWNRGERGRKKILALRDGYHGDTFGAMSVSERGVFTLAFRDLLFDVVFIERPTQDRPLSVAGYRDEETAALLEEAACLIYEPLLQGAGGMKMYAPGPLDALIEKCRTHGVICIADEVMTGFGRTGKLFASEYCKNIPDIICLSKGLTGGTMALGATVCTARIHEAFVTDDRRKSFFHGHSFTANPIACTAALASLDLFDKKECMENIRRITERQQQFTGSLITRSGTLPLKNARCLGTIAAFEVVTGTEGYTSSIGARITAEAMKKGVYLRPLGNTVYVMPPYCITDEELDQVYACINFMLGEVIW